MRSIEKVMLGPERKSHLLSGEEKKITAYHEAGHAVVASVLPKADPVHKVSVVSRGRAAGYTLKLPSRERHLFSRSHFLDEMAVSLGGYAAEKIVFGDLTTGAADDLQNATDTARALVVKYGMSDKVGPVALGAEGGAVFLGKELGAEKNYSEEMAKEVDEEVKRFMSEAAARAEKILRSNREALDAVASRLVEKETIERAEFEKIISSFGIEPKKDEAEGEKHV